MFLGGATYFANHVSHVQERVDIWLDPFARDVVDDEGYQIAQSLFAQADGGLFGQGFGQALLELPGGATILPAAHTDLIYALITNEIGLFGAVALIVVYLLFAARGFKTALIAGDGFSKLLAAGLTAVFCAPGVRDRRRRDQGDPAHRRDAAVRLLRRQLDRGEHRAARAAPDRVRRRAPPRPAARRPGLNRQIVQLFGLVVVLFGVLVVFTSRWTVFEAESLEDNTANRRPLIEELQGAARA